MKRPTTVDNAVNGKQTGSAAKLAGFRALALASSAAIVIGTAACGPTIGKVTSYIEKAEYDSALDTFDKIKITDKNIDSIVDELNVFITGTVDRFAANEIGYDEATKILDTIRKMGVDELKEQLSLSTAEVNTLNNSKAEYEAGRKSFEEGDYIRAARHFAQVIERDGYYADAQKKVQESNDAYINNALEKARKLAGEGNFDGAIDELYYALGYFPENQTLSDQIKAYREEKDAAIVDEAVKNARQLADAGDYDSAIHVLQNALYNAPNNETLIEKIAEFQAEKEAAILKAAKDEAIAAAQEDAKNEDYPAALEILNQFRDEYTTEDSDVNALITEYSNTYVNFILEKVNILRENKQYLQAIQMLEVAKNVVPSSVELDEAYNQIQAEKPTYLCDVKFQNSGAFEELELGTSITDTMGNVYNPGNVYIMRYKTESWSGDTAGYVEYTLGYRYARIAGMLSVNDTSADMNIQVVFEGDGTILATYDINRLCEPMPVEVDISMVNVLKIYLAKVDGEGEFNVILSEFTFAE